MTWLLAAAREIQLQRIRDNPNFLLQNRRKAAVDGRSTIDTEGTTKEPSWIGTGNLQRNGAVVCF